MIVTNSADASLTAIADLVTDLADLQNGPDSLVLQYSTGTVIDTLGYGDGAPGAPVYEVLPAVDTVPGKSLSRDIAHTDTDDNSADFTETTPTPKENISPDSDGDGLTDAEENSIGTYWNNPDSDGDNLNDHYEVTYNGGSVAMPTDTDNDGDIDALDPDDDGDGVPTLDEDLDSNLNPTDDDSDADTVPNYLDTDDDDDSILTTDEDINCNGDPTDDDIDADGLENYLDDDDDGDGIDTVTETGTDSDSDGLDDALESNTDDLDGDAITDHLDDDDDGDSVPTADEDLDSDQCWHNDDTDEDFIPNFLDNDDDNDGILTIDEDANANGNLDDDDDDADGIPDYLDDTFDCPYLLAGEVTGDCRIDIEDFAVLASNWLTDCILTPLDPDCVPKNPVIPCDHDEFTAVSESAFYYAGVPAMHYTAASSGIIPADHIRIEIDQSIGGPSSPGTYVLPGDNYSTAAVNVLILSDCDGSMVCSKTFLAQSGTLDITSIGGVGSIFAGTLSDVILIEVTIDLGTFDSTPVADGEEWCIADYAFNVTVE